MRTHLGYHAGRETKLGNKPEKGPAARGRRFFAAGTATTLGASGFGRGRGPHHAGMDVGALARPPH